MESRAVWAASGLEVRQQGQRPAIVGSFPYNTWAVLSDRGTVRKEEILPGAFDFTLSDPDAEVNLLFGHSFDRPLASRSGGSLELQDSDKALTFRATIPEGAERVSHVADALAMIAAGLATGISPGFRVPPKDVVPDAEKLTPEPGNPGVMIRQLAALVLYELSIVTRPAYPATSAELRKMPCNRLHAPQRKVLLP
ncbi:Caudovirus prohead serine protease [Antarctobacter heliothermus]|uniref:Caudovirus prohead serine protease n=1 Tax=Antarctobacter heliothermus TaxID=74033 RepID=A0A222E783_9RHOB|nr:HK97 family phage prohead protease [Antarctobacter heliothermus]ASP22055.1 Caudovirus prohead serine protease [Antarctobacter heliothermus]